MSTKPTQATTFLEDRKKSSGQIRSDRVKARLALGEQNTKDATPERFANTGMFFVRPDELND